MERGTKTTTIETMVCLMVASGVEVDVARLARELDVGETTVRTAINRAIAKGTLARPPRLAVGPRINGQQAVAGQAQRPELGPAE